MEKEVYIVRVEQNQQYLATDTPLEYYPDLGAANDAARDLAKDNPTDKFVVFRSVSYHQAEVNIKSTNL